MIVKSNSSLRLLSCKCCFSLLGYGTISPSTNAGQVLCIVFAVLGIPVAILAFQSVGELMSRGITFMIAKIEKQCLKRDPTNVEAKCTAVTCALMLVLLLCAVGIQMADNWSFLEGFYFWFITFTTIGYGDYMTDETGSGWAVMFHLVWTTLGLCAVSCALNALATFISRRQSSALCSCSHGNRELKETDSDGEKENEHEKRENENTINEKEKNGREAFRVDCNGTGTSKGKDQYNSVTYV